MAKLYHTSNFSRKMPIDMRGFTRYDPTAESEKSSEPHDVFSNRRLRGMHASGTTT
jgi:hypothetical protein